jgi:hypothetical protein
MLTVGLEAVLARWQWHGGLNALELQFALFSELWQDSMALILLKLTQKSGLSLALLELFVSILTVERTIFAQIFSRNASISPPITHDHCVVVMSSEFDDITGT